MVIFASDMKSVPVRCVQETFLRGSGKGAARNPDFRSTQLSPGPLGYWVLWIRKSDSSKRPKRPNLVECFLGLAASDSMKTFNRKFDNFGEKFSGGA